MTGSRWRLPPDDAGDAEDACRTLSGFALGALISVLIWAGLLWLFS